MNKIKSVLLSVTFVGMLLLMLMVGGYCDTRYNTVATVMSVDENGTTFVDGAGYVWAVSDVNYHVGQFVKLYFDNNTTDYTRNDDIIVRVKILDN